MEQCRMSLPPLERAGAVATFYSYDSGATRSMALANMAVMLAGREGATQPVLMIDWDTESPTLHHVFDQRDEHAGLLDLFEACRDYLQVLGLGPGSGPGDPHDTRLAMQVLDAVDWQRYVQRVDQSRSLYLMRAGCFDADYGRRASQMDWEGLFETCPALFRCFAQEAARYFRHVMVDARGGRSTTVSICTTLLPDKLVTLFSPNQRSLDGLEGVVTRAIHYRRSHAEEQRPLVVYPVACAMDSTDSERRREWRRGESHKGIVGYQRTLERLMRHCYGASSVSLDSYLDEVQLQQALVMACGVPLVVRDEHGGDRFSLTRSIEALLAWFADGYFPWQTQAEITVLADIAVLRAGTAGSGHALALPLARALDTLGRLHHAQGQQRQALDSFNECAALRAAAIGSDHADTLAARTSAADMLRHLGKLNEAHTHYAALDAALVQLHGIDHPATWAARAGLAGTLAQQNQFAQALALEESISASAEQRCGASDPATLDSIARQADILSHQGELSRARHCDERVLAGRRKWFGAEHRSTLAAAQHLALVLCRLGDLAQARRLQEQVVAAHVRHGGNDDADTLHAREALATIFAEQGDLGGLRHLQESLAHAREHKLGSEHPETLSCQLRLAATLGQQGELDAARRLHEHVSRLHEHLRHEHGADGMAGKMAMASLSMPPGHAAALRHLDDTVRQASERLRQLAHGKGASAHDAEQADLLNRRIDEVQQLVESGKLEQARDLADSLRKPLLRPGVGPRQRVRGMAALKRVYQIQGDQQALAALHEAEARARDDPLSAAQAVNQ